MAEAEKAYRLGVTHGASIVLQALERGSTLQQLAVCIRGPLCNIDENLPPTAMAGAMEVAQRAGKVRRAGNQEGGLSKSESAAS
jgi:hypothetical protein